MKLFWWRPLIVLMLLSPLAEAKKVAYFWGGGGEPQSKTSTIFDRDLQTLGPAMKAAGYELHVAFAKGHRDSEKLAGQFVGPGKNQDFTPAVVKNELNKLEAQILGGELQEGDQILFVISTHGFDPDDNPDVTTHMVRTSNFKATEGIGLDRLFSIRDLAEKRNIKLALLDLSCYSGSSLALASAKTCVMSSSTAQELSYSHLAPELALNLRPGIDLESAFLQARRRTADFEAPEISTFANSIAKVLTIINSTANSPLKRENSDAALIRQQNYLQTTHGLDLNALTLFLAKIPDAPELNEMKSVRETYQALAAKKPALSFDRLDEAKAFTLLRYYSNERSFYDKIYRQFQNEARPNPCRDFRF